MNTLNRRLRAVQGLLISRLLSSRGGQDLIEYALVAGFIAVAVAATIPYVVKEPMMSIYTTIASQLQRALN